MNAEELAGILKSGAVVTIDAHAWAVESAHSEADMPDGLSRPAPDENENDWLDRQMKWWDSLLVCDSKDTPSVVLIEALCRLAGVRVRRP